MNVTTLQRPGTEFADRTVWAIDPLHSTVGFSIKLMGLASVHGRFGGILGTIQLVGDRPAAVGVMIDAASIDTGIEKRDAHLRSADFLDVAIFPTFSFRSTRVEPVGALPHLQWRIRGYLTIHGVTRPVELVAERTSDGPNPWTAELASFEAITKISRKDFGVGVNVPLTGNGLVIGDEVTIKIAVQARNDLNWDR